MKIILGALFLVGFVVCEVPPPYPPRGFRPNPAFNLPIRQPQTTYGVPNAIPSKLSLVSPQTQYSVPNQQAPSRPNLSQNFNSKQTIPSTSYGVPLTNSPYRTITRGTQASTQQGVRNSPNFSSQQTIPNTSYGAPVTISPYRTIVNEPQVIYGAPSAQSRPSGQYDAPDVKNIETLEQVRQLNSLLQLIQSSNLNQQKQIDVNSLQSQNLNGNVGTPSQQYLPVKGANNFRGDLQVQSGQRNVQQPALEYLPVKEPINFRNGFDLSRSNVQEPFNVQPDPNVQRPSQQYLPVREPLNFKKFVPQTNAGINPSNDLTGQNVQPTVNYQQPANTPQEFNGAGNIENKLVNLNQQYENPNVAQSSENRNPTLNTYNAHQQNNIEIERLNIRPLPSPSKVQISAPQNVVQPVQTAQQNREFEGSNIQGANRGQANERYLPPSTVRPIQRPTSPSTPVAKDNSGEDELTDSREETGGPNISVATAVSGVPSGQSFYVLQPDGRLQRVIYQKTRAEGDRENEYTANYLFQNIQADPGLVYSPLVALGKR